MVLELTEQRLQSAKDRVDRFIDDNLLMWTTEEVLLPGQQDMLDSGLSEKAAFGLSLEKTGFKKIDLVWRHFDDEGKPIHFFIEFDTRPHTIEAKGRLTGGADALHWVGPSGKDVFAKIVQHPGTKGKGLVSTIHKERMPSLERRIINETTNRMEIDAL